MTAASDAAIVRIVIADFALADTANKVNILGSGIRVVGIPDNPALPDALKGSSAPFAVVAWLHLPSSFVGQSAHTEISLIDSSNRIVLNGRGDDQTPVSFADNVTLNPSDIDPRLEIPRGDIGPRIQWTLTFPTGLIVSPGAYRWRLTIDGVTKPEWEEPLHLAKVLGGIDQSS